MTFKDDNKAVKLKPILPVWITSEATSSPPPSRDQKICKNEKGKACDLVYGSGVSDAEAAKILDLHNRYSEILGLPQQVSPGIATTGQSLGYHNR
jgi:hypothetical protein